MPSGGSTASARRDSRTSTASWPRSCPPACSGSSEPPKRKRERAVPPATSVVEHEIRITARPETVFGYFTDPARLVQWMGADATLDPRPGGVFRMVFQPTPEVAGFMAAASGMEGRPAAAGLDLSVNAILGKFVEV